MYNAGMKIESLELIKPCQIDRTQPLVAAFYGIYNSRLLTNVTGLHVLGIEYANLCGVGLRFQPYSDVHPKAKDVLDKTWRDKDFLGGFSMEVSPKESIAVQITRFSPDTLDQVLTRLEFYNLHGDWYSLARLTSDSGLSLFTEVIINPETGRQPKLHCVESGFLHSPRVNEHRRLLIEDARSLGEQLNSLHS